MKPKGIWIVIGMLLAIGIFSTDYVKKKTEGTTETSMAASVVSSDLAGRIPEYKGTEQEPAKAGEGAQIPEARTKKLSHPFPIATAAENKTSGPEAEAGIELKEEDGPGSDQDREAALSGDLQIVEEEPKNPAIIRLQELDEQIARNQPKESEATTNSRKASAENEWRLWDGELQRILGILKEKLDEEAQKTLMYDQIEWMKSSEASSVGASQKQMGSAMEEVNYNRSRAGLTRARAYELAELYGEFLTE